MVSLMSRIRLWVLTILVTCLIWIAADQGVTKTEEINLSFSVRPKSANTMSVSLLDSVKNINVAFTGPNRLINQLKSVRDELSIQLEVSERDTGKYSLDLLNELRSRSLEGISSGLSIVSVYPAIVTIEVDRYVNKEVRLRLDKGDLEIDGEPVLNPAMVVVTVQEKKFNSLSDTQKELVISTTSVFKGAHEGELVQKQIPVPREIAGIPVIQVEPQQVTVSATMKVRTAEGRIPTVPIRILAGNDVIERYRVILGKQQDNIVTCEVSIRGPAEKVRDLEANASKYGIEGFVKITMDDARRERTTSAPLLKQPEILNLPDEVEVIKKQPDAVEIQLVPRG